MVCIDVDFVGGGIALEVCRCVCFNVDFVGGGIATDESTQGLPLNAVDFDTLKPHLSFLLNIYGINYVRSDILF